MVPLSMGPYRRSEAFRPVKAYPLPTLYWMDINYPSRTDPVKPCSLSFARYSNWSRISLATLSSSWIALIYKRKRMVPFGVQGELNRD